MKGGNLAPRRAAGKYKLTSAVAPCVGTLPLGSSLNGWMNGRCQSFLSHHRPDAMMASYAAVLIRPPQLSAGTISKETLCRVNGRMLCIRSCYRYKLHEAFPPLRVVFSGSSTQPQRLVNEPCMRPKNTAITVELMMMTL